jgi:hypothetical protein
LFDAGDSDGRRRLPLSLVIGLDQVIVIIDFNRMGAVGRDATPVGSNARIDPQGPRVVVVVRRRSFGQRNRRRRGGGRVVVVVAAVAGRG